MSLFQLLIIAAIQGITEWLPISSSAHVLLLSDTFGADGRDELLLNAVSNLGTLAAMLVYFRKDVASAVVGGFELAAAPVTKRALSPGARLAACVLIATPVALVAGLLYEGFLPEDAQNALRSVPTVAGATIVFGLLLWWADARGARNRKEEDMTFLHALIIGATQAVAAIIPGTSRSGITMTAARALGYDRTEAARFSMLIGAPILAAAGLYGAYGLFTADPEAGAMLTFEDGMIVAAVAFITGLASIWGLMALLKRMSFLPFVIYRVLLGVLLFAMMPYMATS
ncbi:undecaprenyl-diphosphate phosphatase [Henriciella pelagia]|uniref:undecaprenyl-diphosphate phosphatase n=1 Tax=Henriciella pelagia TaxID=1977912 RepID=UPI003517E130